MSELNPNRAAIGIAEFSNDFNELSWSHSNQVARCEFLVQVSCRQAEAKKV